MKYFIYYHLLLIVTRKNIKKRILIIGDNMLVFVMYDIVDTPTRTNLVKKLKHYGLRRIQKSIFCGFLTIKERLDLASEFDLFMSSERDTIILIPACESCLDSVFIEGNLDLPTKSLYEFV